MVRHSFTIERPSLVTGTLGGAAGAVLYGAVLNVAPAAGAAAVDLPRLVGTLFGARGDGALWLGFGLLFLIGWLLLPLLLSAMWEVLPGESVGFRGAPLKGLAFGAALWALTGVLLPLLGTAAGAETASGFFALGAGAGAAATLLVASFGYALVAAVIAAMSQGLAPIDALGWEGHGAGRAA